MVSSGRSSRRTALARPEHGGGAVADLELAQSGLDQARAPGLEIDRGALLRRLDEFALLGRDVGNGEREPPPRRLGSSIGAGARIKLGRRWNEEVAEIDGALFGTEDDGRGPGPGPLRRLAGQVARERLLDLAAGQTKQHGLIDRPLRKPLELAVAAAAFRHVEKPLVEQVVEQPPAIDRRAKSFRSFEVEAARAQHGHVEGAGAPVEDDDVAMKILRA